MAHLTIDADGLVLIQIDDAKGESHTYRVERVEDLDPGYWSVRVTRLDTGDSYLVGADRRNHWECECMDFKVRGDKVENGPRQKRVCKHITHCRALRAAVLRLALA